MHRSDDLMIGRAGQYLTMFDLLTRGYECFTTDEGVPYDVVLVRGSKLIRLQVKTTRGPKIHQFNKFPVYQFNVRRAGKGGKRMYEIDEFDGFALVTLDTKQIAYMPFTSQMNKTIWLRKRGHDYGAGNKPRPYVDEFTFDSFIKNYD